MRLNYSKKPKFKPKVKPVIKFKPTNINNCEKVFNLNQNQINELRNIINKQKEEPAVEPERERVVIEPIVKPKKEDVIINPIVKPMKRPIVEKPQLPFLRVMMMKYMTKLNLRKRLRRRLRRR